MFALGHERCATSTEVSLDHTPLSPRSPTRGEGERPNGCAYVARRAMKSLPFHQRLMLPWFAPSPLVGADLLPLPSWAPRGRGRGEGGLGSYIIVMLALGHER